MSAGFETRFAAARDDFLQAAREAGARIETHDHPRQGLQGEALAADVAWVGPTDAARVLLTVSGTHGVEGIYGSACQRAHLRQLARDGLPPGQALLAVHAINPFGFAWLRRVDHENIDVNRNHVDFSRPLPANLDYPQVHQMLDDLIPTPSGLAAFEAGMRAFIARAGRAAHFAITGGQYTHPDGIFFGGQGPCWSQQVREAICARWLSQARAVAVLDHHTGLGPRGHTELICRHPVGSPSLALAREWFGADVTSPDAGESQSAVLDGNLRMAIQGWFPQATVVAIALEAGTLEETQVLRALVADHWLHRHGDPASPAGDLVRRQMQAAFYCDDEAWRTQVLARSLDLHRAAQIGLAGLPVAGAGQAQA